MTFFIGLPEQMAKATPARWTRALERARLAQVRIRRADDLGTYRVTSASRPGITYVTDGFYCTCDAAGEGDPVCLHRAAVRSALALMNTQHPEPDPSGPVAAGNPHAEERAACYAALERHNAELAQRGRVDWRTERAAAAAIERLDEIGYANKVAA